MFNVIETDLIQITAEQINNQIFLHANYDKTKPFTKSVYFNLLLLWEDVKQAFSQIGVDEVFSIVTKANIKVNKWQRMFGMSPFKETDEYIIYRGLTNE